MITETLNRTPKEILKNSILAACGLFLFGVGVHLTIQANIGVAPWDAFCLGLNNTFGIKYGTASIIISITLIIINMILKERIGIGTILDAFIVGKTVDLCDWLGIVPEMNNIFSSLILMLIGMIIMGFAQFLYMKAALCCGPRDGFLVALGKRFTKIPIGVISICILFIVLIIGWRLGGPIGIGTIVATFGTGPIMQADFALVKFNPTKVKHQDVFTSMRIIAGDEKVQ